MAGILATGNGMRSPDPCLGLRRLWRQLLAPAVLVEHSNRFLARSSPRWASRRNARPKRVR